MAESTSPSTPLEAHEATVEGGESKDGKYGGKTVQEHSDVSLKDYDPSDDKFKDKDRVVTHPATGASLVVTDTEDGAAGLGQAQADASADSKTTAKTSDSSASTTTSTTAK